MANVIQVKRNVYTGTGNPAAANVAYGELAWNNGNGADNAGELWIGQQTGTNPVVIVPRRINKSVAGTDNEIAVSEAAEAFTVGLPDDVTVTGDLAVGGDVAVSGGLEIAGDTVITGGLQVDGTTTTINSTTVSIDDLTFVVAADAADSSAANGAGLIVASDIAKFTYSNTGTKWVSSKPLDVTGTCTATAFSGPITGAVTGNASTATALATARNIGGVSFDGTADITLPGVNSGGSQDTTGNAATATALATARNIGGVSFDGSANIDLPGVNSGGDQDTSGNAATATILATARNIGGVSFNGSANIDLPGVNSGGDQDTTGEAATVTSIDGHTVDGGTYS